MKKTRTTLNNRRLELLRKGYVNQKELGEFLEVGKSKAAQIYRELSIQITSKGKCIDILGIRTVYALDYLGFTEEDIRRFAKDESRYKLEG